MKEMSIHTGAIPVKRLLAFSQEELRTFIQEKNSAIRTAIQFHTREKEQQFEDHISRSEAEGDYWFSGIAHIYLFFDGLRGSTEEIVNAITESCVKITEHVLHEAKKSVGFVLKKEDEEYATKVLSFCLLAGYLATIVKGLRTITTLEILDVVDVSDEIMEDAIMQTREAIVARYGIVH